MGSTSTSRPRPDEERRVPDGRSDEAVRRELEVPEADELDQRRAAPFDDDEPVER